MTKQVKDMRVQDGKFKFKLGDRLVWGYVIFTGCHPGEVIKLDGEHTYLWYRDERIEQTVLAVRR